MCVYDILLDDDCLWIIIFCLWLPVAIWSMRIYVAETYVSTATDLCPVWLPEQRLDTFQRPMQHQGIWKPRMPRQRHFQPNSPAICVQRWGYTAMPCRYTTVDLKISMAVMVTFEHQVTWWWPLLSQPCLHPARQCRGRHHPQHLPEQWPSANEMGVTVIQCLGILWNSVDLCVGQGSPKSRAILTLMVSAVGWLKR